MAATGRFLILLFASLVLGLAFNDDGGNKQDFKGTIGSLPVWGVIGDWMVSGSTVRVTAATEVRADDGPIVTGACVEVKGQFLADLSVLASEVRTQKSGDCPQVQQKNVDFTALVQSMPMSGMSGDWVVNGQMVHATSSTTVKQGTSPIVVGSCVEVKGQRNSDSSVSASEIDGEPNSACGTTAGVPVDFQGTVQKLPVSGLIGDWTVAALTIHVSAATQISQDHGPVAVGSCVELKGQGLTDGSVNASEIDIRSSSAGCGVQPPPAQQDLLGLVQTLPASGLPGDWQVSGRTVHVSLSTLIRQQNGVVAAGACVDVQGTFLADTSLNALQIETQPASKCAATIGGVSVDFDGTVAKLPSSGTTGDWQVGGTTVHVLPGTSIELNSASALAIGQCVEVKGQMLADQTVDALSFEAKSASACVNTPPAPEVEIMGLVEKLPLGGGLIGDWQVSGQVVHALPGTSIEQEEGAVAVGACVNVKGALGGDRSLTATRIEVESVSGTCIRDSGVVDAASLLAGGVSPGELISVFGLRVGPPGLTRMQIGSDGKVTTSLAGVQVLFDGQPAPLLAVTNNQINAIVPFAVAGKTTTQVQVEDGGAWSNPVNVPVVAAHPALFSTSGSGRDQAASVNEDGSLNSGAQPAVRGSIVVLFATGFGATNRNVQDGEVVGDAQTKPILPVTVQIGGINAELMFAGMAPREVAGVIQLNVRIPANSPTGTSVPVQVKVGDFTTRAGVTLAILK